MIIKMIIIMFQWLIEASLKTINIFHSQHEFVLVISFDYNLWYTQLWSLVLPKGSFM